MSDKFQLKPKMKIWWKYVPLNDETFCDFVIQISPSGAAVQVHPLLGQAAPTAGRWISRQDMNVIDALEFVEPKPKEEV